MQTVRTNLSNNAPTQYTNYDFQSMVLFNGLLLGAGSMGLRKLCCGTTDAGTAIASYFKTRSSLLNWDGKKKNRFIYLAVKTSGTVIITPIIDGVNGTAITFTPSNSETKYMKMSVSSDNMGYYWEYKVENVSGSTFSIEEITVLPVYLSKRK